MSPHGAELWTDKIQAWPEGERATAQAVGEAAEPMAKPLAAKGPPDVSTIGATTQPWRPLTS